MDEEDTRSYKEPCPQCTEIHWGISDEGKFYCKNCHTVIEKTKELDESEIYISHAKVQSINRGLRKAKKKEWGWEWYICEGFQFILCKQAEALEALGLGPNIKDNVMCNLWRQYLQKTEHAYCNKTTSKRSRLCLDLESSGASSSELESEPEGCITGVTSDSDVERGSQSSLGLPPSGGYSGTSDAESATSVQSGSVDGCLYIKKTPSENKMTMPMTLAFCYLSLLWVRASVTLTDLLRLVFYHHIPYYNPQECFPETTRVYGPDIWIFDVQNFPAYNDILKLTCDLGRLLQLPRFPPIIESCYYHPNVLCMKYLMEVNLPDELHGWTCFVAEKTKLDEANILTYNPRRKRKRFIPYDIQAMAIIVVVLKLIFILDDESEWQLAKLARKTKPAENEATIFDFRKWYTTMRSCMDEAHKKLEEEQARFAWSNDIVMSYTQKSRSRIMKRKRMAKNLQNQFSKLAGAAPDAGNRGPSSFVFNWQEQNTSTICFHGHSLEGIAQKDKKQLPNWRKNYWLNSVKKCTNVFCKHWRHYDESQFPSSYRFVISLFALVLRVEPCLIHYEVSLVEGKLFKEKPTKKKRKSTRRKKTL
ncbi:TATA box-binding protein-associated factor RNA polymerase I subunit B [Leptodactylus fuscus]|uniref:TATA box-binding protein-associated factor RNA polymerase I subunit B n=1 Tax=Leptodactylus fuscus TaxID=238119 RepID=UPI003F4F37A2